MSNSLQAASAFPCACCSSKCCKHLDLWELVYSQKEGISPSFSRFFHHLQPTPIKELDQCCTKMHRQSSKLSLTPSFRATGHNRSLFPHPSVPSHKVIFNKTSFMPGLNLTISARFIKTQSLCQHSAAYLCASTIHF